MTVDESRSWLITSSLAITAAQMVFLITAPVVGYPLQYPKNLDLLQIVTPVFLGYLGAAAHFIFRNPAPEVHVQNKFLGLLVRGPLIIYVVVTGSALGAFGYANRPSAAPGTGMSVPNLATTLSLSLGLLAATTSVINSYLFAAPLSGDTAAPTTPVSTTLVSTTPVSTTPKE